MPDVDTVPEADLDKHLRQVVEDMQAEIRERVNARKAGLEAGVKQIKDKAPEGGEIGLGFDFDVTWKDVEFIFSLPSVTLRDQRIVIGLPEVTMRDQALIFHTPSVRMVLRKVGQYPEIHGFTVVWKDILTEIPEPFMQEQRIVMGIPEFAMRDQEFIVGVPEFQMVENRVVLGLPQFKLREVSVVSREMKNDAETLKTQTDEGIRADLKEVGGAAQAKITTAVAGMFQASRNKLESSRAQTMVIYDNLVASFQSTLQQLGTTQAADTLATVKASLDSALQSRANALAKFEEQAVALAAQERQVVSEIIKKLAPEEAAAGILALGGVDLRRYTLGRLTVR